MSPNALLSLIPTDELAGYIRALPNDKRESLLAACRCGPKEVLLDQDGLVLKAQDVYLNGYPITENYGRRYLYLNQHPNPTVRVDLDRLSGPLIDQIKGLLAQAKVEAAQNAEHDAAEKLARRAAQQANRIAVAKKLLEREGILPTFPNNVENRTEAKQQ